MNASGTSSGAVEARPSAERISPINRLLVLEDERAFGDYLVDAARKRGVDARRVATVKAFQDAFNSFKPNLLVLDLVLGHEDVCPVVEFLGTRRCTAPIFFMSGYNRRLIYTVSSLARSNGLLVADSFEKQKDGMQRLLYKLDAYLIR